MRIGIVSEERSARNQNKNQKNDNRKRGASLKQCAGAGALLAAVMAVTPRVSAANLYWDPANTTNGSTVDPGDGLWDLAATVWNNSTTDVAWTQTNATTATNAAFFTGNDGTYKVNVAADIAAQSLNFSASGYVFTSAAPQTIYSGAVNINAGKTETVGANVTLSFGGSFYLLQPNVSRNKTGTLNIENGGTVQTTGGGALSIVGTDGVVNVNAGGTLRTGTGVLNVAQPSTTGTGATLNVNGGTVSTAGGPGIVVSNGNSGTAYLSAVGTLNVNSGTVTIGGTGTLVVGGGTSSVTNTSTGLVNLNGGILTTGSGGVSLAIPAQATGTFNLNGGTLNTNKIFKTAGTGTFNFNGGTLVATASNATYMQDLTAANVKSGGAIINTNGFNIGINQPLLGGAGDGGLTKNGAGTLVLGGANTYTGATNVNAGNLQVDGSLNAASAVTVAGGATLSGGGTINGAVTTQSGAHINPGTTITPATLNVGALTLNAGTALDFELGSSSDLINVLNPGGLTLNGGTINLFGTGGINVLRAAGTYTLLDYTGTLNGSLSNLSIANRLAGKQYTLFNDTVNSLIGLTITDLRSDWTGGAGDNKWTTAGNWNGVVPNTAGYNARFGTLGTPTTVQVDGAKTVGAITFDNSSGSYTISGGAGDVISLNAGSATTAALNVDSGSHFIAAPLVLQSDTAATLADGTMLTVSGNITGAKNLGVFGPGTLVLTGANGYATTSVSNGKLQLGDGGTAGTLGTGDVTLNTAGVLSVNRSDTVALNNNIGGANGTVSQDGAGTLVLGGVNTFGTTAGGLIVNAGTVKLGSATAMPTGAIVTLNNGTLDLNGFDATSSAFTGAQGTTVTDTSATAGTSTLVLNQAGNSTISSAILDGATRKVGLTKQGVGNVTLDGTAANTYTGLTTITQGTLTLNKNGVQAIAGNVQIGDGVDSDVLSLMASDQIADTSVLTFTAGPSGSSAFLRLNGFNETVQGIQTTIGQAAVIENGTGGTGTLTVNTAGHDYTYDGILRNSTGTLALTKAGDGTLTLANTAKVTTTSYTGTTTVAGGRLVLDNLDAFSSPIVVNSTAADALTFNQTTRNLTLNNAVQISGTGAVTKTGAGTLTIANSHSYTGPTTVAGGTLVLNGSLDAGSTVTVANGATLAGTGTANGTVIVQSGGHISPGTATTAGSIYVGGLTLNQGSLLDFEFGNSSDLININNPDSLTLNGGGFNLFGPGGVTPLSTNGTYALLDYNNTFLGNLSNLKVNNPIVGKLYTFTDDPNSTLISLTIADNASEWSGNAGDGKWTTAGNWTGGIPNSFGVKALFGQIPQIPTTVAVNGPKLVSGMVFDNYNGYALTGGAADVITMDAGASDTTIQVLNGNHTIGAPITFNSNLGVSIASGWTLGLNGNLTGAAKNLSLAGEGTLILGGTNTYAATMVNGGTLQVGNGGAAGTLGQGDVTVGATGKLSFNRSDTVTVANNIGGASGTVSQDGTGTLILSGNNTFGTAAGGLLVNNGTVKFGSATAVSPLTITTINNGTLDINGMNAAIGSLGGTGGVLTDNGSVAGTSTVRVTQTTNTNFSGAITDGTSRKIAFIKDGPGVLTVDGSALNTYTGGTTVVGGTLLLSKFGGNALVGDILIGDTIGGDAVKLGASDQIPDTSVLTFNSGGNFNSAFLQLNGFNETVQGIQTTSGQAAVIENGSGFASVLTVNTAGHDYTYDGILRNASTGTLGLVKSGKGTLTIANSLKVVATNNTGDTVINDGKLVLDNLDAFSSPITNNSPEPDALTFNQGIKNMVIGGGVLISGTGGVTKTGPFYLKMTAPSTYAGDTKILDGTIIAANSTALPSGAGKGNVVMDGGATVAGTLDVGGNDVNINGLSGASGAVLGQVINSGATAATLTVGNGDATAAFAGVVRDNAGTGSTLGLSKTGAGVQTLSGVNTYSGATSVNGGTLKVSGSIANSSGVSVNTGTFEAASSQTVKSLTVATGAVAQVTRAAATATVLKVGDNVNTSPLSVSGKLDLKTNGLIVDVPSGSEAGTLTSVRGLILSGFNPSTPGGTDGKWDGNGILSSSITAGKAVGYALASEVTSGPGASFMGTPVDGSAVVARYTLAGDATLDGSVNFGDLVKLAQNYNTTVSASSDSWWNKGDFTYDGIVDFNDLVKLAQNYNTALPTEPVPGASAVFEADLARAFASVPEPSALGLVGVGLAGLLSRRRRRHNA